MRLISFLSVICFSSPSFGSCEPAADTSRVVVAGGSITEIIYYLDMDNYLVARDLTSNYPVKALSLPSVGYVRNLATEGLLSLMPTLVLGEADAGPPNVIEKLREIKVDVRIVKTSHDAEGVIKKTLCVGNIMGMSAEQLDAKLVICEDKRIHSVKPR